MESKLGKCPFCKSEKVSVWTDGIGDYDFFISCHKCYAQGPMRRTERGAVNGWNRVSTAISKAKGEVNG
jgi:transcription elongation factor Elf1